MEQRERDERKHSELLAQLLKRRVVGAMSLNLQLPSLQVKSIIKIIMTREDMRVSIRQISKLGYLRLFLYRPNCNIDINILIFVIL